MAHVTFTKFGGIDDDDDDGGRHNNEALRFTAKFI